MNKRTFFNILKDIQEYRKLMENLDYDYDISLYGSFQDEMVWSLLSHLWHTNFKEEGVECINWYLNKPNDNDVDPDLYVSLTTHKPVTIKTPKELWKYISNFKL